MNRRNSSMQLTRAADYGVRVMMELAAQPGGVRISLPALTQATGTPESFLSKILQALAHAGLIHSRRGHSGGFELTARGRGASVREVVEAIDGPVVLNTCLTDKRSCARSCWCPAHPVWFRVQQAMMTVLEEAKISDLAAQISAPAMCDSVEREGLDPIRPEVPAQ